MCSREGASYEGGGETIAYCFMRRRALSNRAKHGRHDLVTIDSRWTTHIVCIGRYPVMSLHVSHRHLGGW